MKRDIREFITGLPAAVTSVAVDTWQDVYGMSYVVVWDRTGHEPDDGEWGNDIYMDCRQEYDFRSDSALGLSLAGFNFSGPRHDAGWVSYDLPEGAGLILTATR